MTDGAPTLDRAGTGAVRAFAERVDGIAMTGLVAGVERPRAVVLGMHGAGSSASYWHGTAHPDQSLLRLAAGLGFTAVALDQPGYASSAGQVDGWSRARRADLVARTVTSVVDDLGAGVVVVAHSQGTQISAHLAARFDRVIGLEFSGNGRERDAPAGRDTGGTGNTVGTGETGDTEGTPVTAGTPVTVGTPVTAPPDPGDRGRQAFAAIWGSSDLYPGGAISRDQTRAFAAPPWVLEDAASWPEAMPRIAGRVRVPVRITVAEHEGIWSVSPAAQHRLAALFTAAPRVQTAWQRAAPHNISLSSAARAYHLHVLAFAEECAQWAGRR
jgi:pimeloyl-ACP methyl ester carboxylesterase